MTRLFAILFWCAAAFAFVMAVLPHPPHVPTGDKVQHMAAFATLAALGTFGYPRLAPLRLAAGLCAFGALIEVTQMIPVLHRDAELSDWLADTLAVTVVLVAVRLFLRLRANNAQ